jgi:hypothetical protein
MLASSHVTHAHSSLDSLQVLPAPTPRDFTRPTNGISLNRHAMSYCLYPIPLSLHQGRCVGAIFPIPPLITDGAIILPDPSLCLRFTHGGDGGLILATINEARNILRHGERAGAAPARLRNRTSGQFGRAVADRTYNWPLRRFSYCCNGIVTSSLLLLAWCPSEAREA